MVDSGRAFAGLAALVLACALPAPLVARESLGVFDSWAAFRDPAEPRCYAIAMAKPSTLRRDYQPFASIGSWPRKGVHNQLHIRLSREAAPSRPITLILGRQRFTLAGGGADAWATDKTMDAAIVAAMRSAGSLIVSATDARGTRFFNSYDLTGAATALDAAAVGCARL